MNELNRLTIKAIYMYIYNFSLLQCVHGVFYYMSELLFLELIN